LNARTAILGGVAVVLGIAAGHFLLRAPGSGPGPERAASPPSSGLTGPLPIAPEGPVPCRVLPRGNLVLLYPAASASASPLSPAPSEIETNSIEVVPMNGAGTRKAWIYLVISEAEPEVTVSVPERSPADKPPVPDDTPPGEGTAPG
jgi:hypothetical protein